MTNTDMDGYCENDEYEKHHPGGHRDPLEPARPEVGRARLIH
jgi:hypothetical protein